MKKLIVIGMFLMQANLAKAETKSIVLKDETTRTTVSLNSETVRCSDIGYGSLELKVTVPALDEIAYFNHSNPGEQAPCVTAGSFSCGTIGGGQKPWSKKPSDIVDPAKPTEDIDVHVVLTQHFLMAQGDQAGTQKCLVQLKESVETEIRGIPFKHLRSGVVGEMPVALCKHIL
jgi:hypothetical protein